MKRGIFYIVIALLIALVAAEASARPKKGFNTGPYLALEFGISNNNFDENQRTGEKVGTEIEPTIGFLFGWNVYDWLSAELSGRYTTSAKDDRREHIAGANFNAKFFLITDALTDFPTLRILPYAKGGLAIRVSGLPGDTLSSDGTVFSFAYGPSAGAGIMFLFQKYVYLGIDAQGDFLLFDSIHQDLTSGGVTTPNVLIYEGGWRPQYMVMGIAGVHF